MKIKVALALAVVVACCPCAVAEESNIQALLARVAVQEANLQDLQAKMRFAMESKAPAPDAVTSLRKNAAVTIGGLVTTGVYVGQANWSRPFAFYDPIQHENLKATSMELSDAELHFKIDVNDHFDAFIQLDLHNVGDDAANNYGVAKAYYVRWKKICNSGGGLKVGRDFLPFGDDENAAGYLDGWITGDGEGLGWWTNEGGFNPPVISHNGMKFEGVTQITPYWEGMDGALKVELALFQNAWNSDGYMNGNSDGTWYIRRSEGEKTYWYRSRNYGVGSGVLRVTYSPIEDLTLTASAINFRANRLESGSVAHNQQYLNKNNYAVNLAFRYRPSSFNRLALWAQWVHGWNVNNLTDLDSDVVNYGASFDITDRLTAFAQGEYIYENDKFFLRKSSGWASYIGLTYAMPMGAVLEAGWRHEHTRFKNNMGNVTDKVRANMYYANVGYAF
ncbi:MAG: hypothetical protein LUC93_10830 [Planctomycetaceae bacterium]|nr:hypothetical protein [Planctomycetaceae bacterium]